MDAARFNSQYSLFVSLSQFLVSFSSKCQMPCNKLFINYRLLGLYREISDLGPFVQTSPYVLGLHQKHLGPIFLCTDIALG